MSPFATLCLNAFFVWLVFPFFEYRRELVIALRHYFGWCRCEQKKAPIISAALLKNRMRFYRCPELTSAPRPRD
jgi:hypothetical protein